MLNRRLFLKSLSFALIGSVANSLLAPVASMANIKSSSETYNLPIVMLHKVRDNPERPEDITTSELLEVFTYLFENNYRPVNITDIISNPKSISEILANGFKPFAVTVDDADPSVLFSQNNTSALGITDDMPNRLSFIEIYAQSVKPYNITPKATLFISESIPGVYDILNKQRASAPTNKYFGGFLDLPAIVDFVSAYKGIELGYHTCEHIFMKDKNAKETREILEMQMNAFKELGVFDKIKPIFAYPYGVPPSPEGIEVIKELGFVGALLAFPGVNEARYTTLPICEMTAEHTLVQDPFAIPRTNVGSFIYAPPNPEKIPFERIDPIKDLKKDFNI